MNTLRRVQRLARLDLGTFDEAAADVQSTVASVLVAVLSMALLGLGGWLWWLRSGLPNAQGVFLSSVVFGTVFGVALWLLWLLVAYTVLGQLTRRQPRIDAMVRACGLAAAPLALGLLMLVPVVSFALGLVAIVAWVLLTQAAIERATGAQPRAALAANLAGFAVWAGVMSLLSTSQQQLAPGPFLAESLWEAVAGFEAGPVVVDGS